MNRVCKIHGMEGELLIKYIFVFGIIIALQGCLSINLAGVKSSGKLYETFYTGDGGTQYFIKPLPFKNEAKERLKIDLTFRNGGKIEDTVIVNLSLFNKGLLKKIDSLSIDNGSFNLVIKSIHNLFREKNKDQFVERFTAIAALPGLTELFKKNKWNIRIYSQDSLIQYTTPGATQKKLGKLNNDIFSLFGQ